MENSYDFQIQKVINGNLCPSVFFFRKPIDVTELKDIFIY